MTDCVYHVTPRELWEEAAGSGEYAVSGRGLTLAEEGFIHCSSAAQVAATSVRVWGPDQEGLVRLAIDPARLGATELRWERARDGQDYPHLYGPLRADAVVEVLTARVRGGAFEVGPQR